MVFPVVTYGCESWTVKKAERRRTELKIKSLTVSIVSSSICHEVMGPDDLIFMNVEF